MEGQGEQGRDGELTVEGEESAVFFKSRQLFSSHHVKLNQEHSSTEYSLLLHCGEN